MANIAPGPDGTFAAFTYIWLNEINKVGLFEPAGRHPEYRRPGLVRAVMFAGLKTMQNNGMPGPESAIRFQYPPPPLYQRVGFRRQHLIYGYINRA